MCIFSVPHSAQHFVFSLFVFVISFRSCHMRLECYLFSIVFFFFSSRRRHTRFDCDWSSDVCSSDLTSSSYNASPTATATYSYRVTDLASASQCSPGDIVTVNPALVAGAITPPSPSIDNGQSISLSAAPSAGTSPYGYQWFAAASCVSGSQVPGATSSMLVASPSSTTTYSYRVMDSSIGSPAASACSAGN